MSRVRGVGMLLAAAVAFWEGWRVHAGHKAVLACALGLLALALAAWHLTRKPSRPRV